MTFETGTDMDGEDTVIDETVIVGETASLSVLLVAPETAGSYTGYWRLSTTSGDAVGQSVFVLIVVSEDAAKTTPAPTATSSAEDISATDTPTFTPTPSDTPTYTPTPVSDESPDTTSQETSTPETET